VAAVYAWLIWRRVPAVHPRLGLQLAMVLAAVAIPLQIVAGDFAARRVAELQPVKFAAMEGQYETQRGAPLRIGGIPVDGETRYAIEIPKLLSYLGYRDFDAEVMGLNAVPPEDRPNELLTHLSFQVMVGAGFALLFIAGWYWVAWWRRRKAGTWLPGRALHWALVASGFLSFAALQAGWFVTEFGRQPWVVYGYLRTSEGVTEREGILAFFVLFTLLYVVISVGLVVALLRWPHGPKRPARLPGAAGKEAEGVA
jgi:cytochrome d ubiquinol oxidase subunit I